MMATRGRGDTPYLVFSANTLYTITLIMKLIFPLDYWYYIERFNGETELMVLVLFFDMIQKRDMTHKEDLVKIPFTSARS